MKSLPRNRWPRPARFAAILQAALLAAGLIVAPTLHRFSCAGVCSGPRFAVRSERSCGDCCHGHARNGAPSSDSRRSRGCTCLDDCCTWLALFTTPGAPVDAAPPTLLVATPVPTPADAPRAPGARLLPYPTGPPSTT